MPGGGELELVDFIFRLSTRFYIIVLVFLLAFNGAASAQDGDSALAEAIKQAAEQGVSVIVVDGAGQPLSLADEQAGVGQSDEMQASPMMMIQTEFEEFWQELQQRISDVPDSVVQVLFVLRATSPDNTISIYFRVLAWTLLFLVLGRFLTTEVYGKRLMRRVMMSRIQDQPDGYIEKMPFLVVRFFVGMGGTIFGMIFAFLVTTLFLGRSGDNSVGLTAIAIYSAYFLSSTASDLWRMILSPYLSQYRIPAFSDREAKRLFYWASSLAVYDIVAVIFATWVGDFGLNQNLYILVYASLMLVSVIVNMVGLLVNGRTISNAICGGKSVAQCSMPIRALSMLWMPAVFLFLLIGWFGLAADLVSDRTQALPITARLYLVSMTVLVIYGLINYGIEHAFRRHSHASSTFHENEAETEIEAEQYHIAGNVGGIVSTYQGLARRAAGILAVLGGGAVLLALGHSDLNLEDESLLRRSIDVIAVLFIGYLIYSLARIWIDSKIAEEMQDEVVAELGDEGSAASASRLATLLPLFRGAILSVVSITIALMVLMEMGINVSPLFAGAGVVGLAVGFGAQTLVRDMFSGAFFLLDDAFRRGEYINTGVVKGTVEKISVRSFQLRHHLGALHTIPFGEIQVLTNHSRDWVIMKLPLRVTYDTDVEKVRKLIKNLGIKLCDDPEIGHDFLQPLKSQGVIEMQDSAMIIRVKFMTKPGDQWVIRKRVFQEIRDLFEQNDIKFAHREVTVRVVDSAEQDVRKSRRDEVLGAAHAAIEEEFEENDGSFGD